MKYLQLTLIASVYRRYYCLSCLLSLWLKNVDCSLAERWSSLHLPFKSLFQEEHNHLGINRALAGTHRESASFLCCSTCIILDVIVKKLIYSFL